jgi:four helix bundle protein
LKVEDLKVRTFQFGIRCVKLAESLPPTRSGGVIANQLLRCGTSVGANYRAARRARSRAEFVAKLGIVEEECDETIYWMEMIRSLGFVKPAALLHLLREAEELLSIIVAAIKTTKRNIK